jgi:hypothetical protein
MPVKEEKFLVFHKKDLIGITPTQVAVLNEIDELVQLNRMKRNASQFPKYIVCNEDEPYAEKIWEIILDGRKNGN